MLSKCANPACSARFRYLRQGRIFNMEVGAPPSNGEREASHKVEHFWLCDNCSAVMEVVRENGLVSTRRLRPAKAETRSSPTVRGARAN
jgi:hypothetical protein